MPKKAGLIYEFDRPAVELWNRTHLNKKCLWTNLGYDDNVVSVSI